MSKPHHMNWSLKEEMHHLKYVLIVIEVSMERKNCCTGQCAQATPCKTVPTPWDCRRWTQGGESCSYKTIIKTIHWIFEEAQVNNCILGDWSTEQGGLLLLRSLSRQVESHRQTGEGLSQQIFYRTNDGSSSVYQNSYQTTMVQSLNMRCFIITFPSYLKNVSQKSFWSPVFM